MTTIAEGLGELSLSISKPQIVNMERLVVHFI